MFESAPNILESIPQLEDNIPASTFHAAEYGWLVALAAGILLLLIIGLLILRRLRRKAPQPPPTAEQIALRALDHLDSTTLSPKAFSLQLSLIVREFLTGETQDPALFETHEEFSRRMDALSGIPADCRNDATQLLDELARLKYTAGIAHASMPLRPMTDRARSLISRIAEAQRQAQAAAAEFAKLKQ